MNRKRGRDEFIDNESDDSSSAKQEQQQQQQQQQRDEDSGIRRFQCNICSKQYKSMNALNRHTKTHLARRKCDMCEKSYAYINDLNIHRKKVHGVPAKRMQKSISFSCNVCGATFNRLYHLNRHRASVHGIATSEQNRGMFCCRHCDCQFVNYSQLFEHVNKNHQINQQGGRDIQQARSLYNGTENDYATLGTINNRKKQKNDQPLTKEPQVQKNAEKRPVFDESALNNAVQNRNIYPETEDQYDVLTFFANNRDQIRTFLQNRTTELGGIKWNLCVQVEMQKEDATQNAEPYFRSRTYFTISVEDWNEHNLNEALQKMFASLERYMREGSGWYLKKVLKLEIHTAIYKPVNGSTFLPLPLTFSRSRSLLNIQNYDQKCFLYCLLAHLYPVETDPEHVEHYLQHENTLNMKGISYPVTLSQIHKVEKQNERLSINVFTHEEDSVVPLRITEYRNRSYHINLFWLTDGDRSHYCLITNLNRFLSRTNTHKSQLHFCCYCLHGFHKEVTLQEHQPYCMPHGAQRVDLPTAGENDILKFKDFEKTLRVPFVIYADFETINRKLHTCEPNPNQSSTTATTKLEVCSFGYRVICEDENYNKPTVVYRGEDAGRKMIECLLREEEEIRDILSCIEPMDITEEQIKQMENVTNCCLCKKQFSIYDKTNGKVVKHHNHLTGKFIGLSCNSCNLACQQAKFVPVIFHNLKNFDAHILCENLGHFKDKRLKCIAQNTERYVSFSLGGLRFVDSLLFQPTSLEKLVEDLATEGLQSFPSLLSKFGSEKASLLLRKGVYPYEYVDTFDKFNEEHLPPKEEFYSTIKKEHISKEDYDHALSVFQTFNMTSLGQYHDLYLKTDVALLCDTFESFRKVCLAQYELDPCHFYTAPGLAWSSLLKMTMVELELLTQIEHVLMVEVGCRGGLSQVANRFKKANHKYLEDYDESKPVSYLQYLDANNLYGWAMIQPLPVGDFHFMSKKDLETFDVMTIPETGDTGFILEVSLHYPSRLHDFHNCLPLAPEQKVIPNDQLSPYAKHVLRKLYGLKEEDPLPARSQIGKLLATLNDKEKYVLHYRNLQLYVNLGMEIKTIHRVLQFQQRPWMKPYIDFNTEMRKRATSDFQKNFFKLMNVSVFGKTMENVRKRRMIELVHTRERFRKCTQKPTYKNSTIFTEDLVAVELHKAKVKLDKPIYCGMCILDLSKCLMYDFWYNYIKLRYGNSAQLQMTDTDSLLFSCETNDIYEDMKTSIHLFDTSDYPSEHFLYSDRNKKVLGKMKDETNGKPISEFVGLRSKMYSFLCDNREEKRAKGISKVTVKKELKHKHFKNVLFGETKLISSMTSLRSHKHQLFGETIRKSGLSSFDDKRYLVDAVNSYAYGHYKITNNGDAYNTLLVEEEEDLSLDKFKKLKEESFHIGDVKITPCELLKDESFYIDGVKITPCELP